MNKINMLFDTFLPSGPLPNLLTDNRFIKKFENLGDTLSIFAQRPHHRMEIGMTIPYLSQYFLINKKVNFVPSYFCDNLDYWVYPVSFDNPYYYGLALLTGEKPWILDDYVPKKIYNNLCNNKGFLLLFFDGELTRQATLDTFLLNTTIPHNRIIIHSKTILNLENYYHSVFNEIVTIKSSKNYWNSIKNNITKNQYILGMTNPSITDNRIKDKKFICLNHYYYDEYRKYRTLCSAMLIQDNFDNGIMSIGDESNLYTTLEHIKNTFKHAFHEELTLNILKNKKDYSNWDYVHKWIKNNDIARSFFNIILDSYFLSANQPQLYFTEKIYRPIKYKQFFVIFGLPYTLKYFKSLGYKTFHPIIDEKYDEELNDEKRFLMVYNEVQKICSMNLEEVKNLSKKLNSIIEYNYNHVQKRIDQAFIDLEEKIYENT